MENLVSFRNGLPMANPRPTYRKTFIRQWREAKGLTQEQLAERMDISVPLLSQIENGKRPYSQGTLEAAADALGTDPGSLVMRDPSKEEALWSILDGLKPAERKRAVTILDALKRSSQG
jgi:transcriptional regulator with XRE-family HTH domain